MLRHIILLSLFLIGSWHVAAGASEGASHVLKFTVVVLSKEQSVRLDFENELVKSLRANNYDVIASHNLVPGMADFRDPNIAQKLQNEGVQGVLLLKPIDTGEQASITSAQKRVTSTTYNTIEAFVSDYRGGNFNTQAVVQVSGYLLSEGNTSNFWQGIIWLDEQVETQQEGIEKLTELVLSNLNASRGYLRKLLGFQPLEKN
jgi:predicted transcriptional regulator